MFVARSASIWTRRRTMAKIKTTAGTWVEDITGQVFERLTVLELTSEKNFDNRWLWKCQCSCENHTIVYKSMHQLRSGQHKSCGCYKAERLVENNKARQINMTGRRVGKLVVIKEVLTPDNEPKKWLCQCDCGNTTVVPLGELRRGRYSNRIRFGRESCGKCVMSRGEEKVKELLLSMEIVFESQKVFKECRNPETNYCLPFDFFLPEHNCCVEYDGKQHYTGWWEAKTEKGKYASLESIRSRDEVKNAFCLNNGIGLVRIPYTDFNKLNAQYLKEKINDATTL